MMMMHMMMHDKLRQNNKGCLIQIDGTQMEYGIWNGYAAAVPVPITLSW